MSIAHTLRSHGVSINDNHASRLDALAQAPLTSMSIMCSAVSWGASRPANSLPSSTSVAEWSLRFGVDEVDVIFSFTLDDPDEICRVKLQSAGMASSREAVWLSEVGGGEPPGELLVALRSDASLQFRQIVDTLAAGGHLTRTHKTTWGYTSLTKVRAVLHRFQLNRWTEATDNRTKLDSSIAASVALRQGPDGHDEVMVDFESYP